jgi:hypothetical protein
MCGRCGVFLIPLRRAFAVQGHGDKARFLFDGAEQKSTHVLSGYSDAWFVRYQAENYIEIDPLVKHCSQSTLPMVAAHLAGARASSTRTPGLPRLRKRLRCSP